MNFVKTSSGGCPIRLINDGRVKERRGADNQRKEIIVSPAVYNSSSSRIDKARTCANFFAVAVSVVWAILAPQ
jgi:coproporphyrinogen III oxidase